MLARLLKRWRGAAKPVHMSAAATGILLADTFFAGGAPGDTVIQPVLPLKRDQLASLLESAYTVGAQSAGASRDDAVTGLLSVARELEAISKEAMAAARDTGDEDSFEAWRGRTDRCRDAIAAAAGAAA